MIYKMYAVKDTKIGYQSPFLQVSEAVAKRSFKEAVNDTRSEMNRHPEDIELWKVGDYDDQTGKITGQEPKYIIGGKDVLQ